MFPLTKGKGKDLPAEQLPVYRYADLLDKRSFRILELLPGQPHEDISVRLHNAHWDDAPPYDALSYVWGDPNVKNSIICDGQRLDCTPNLISFMKSLRFPPHSGEESSKRERLWPLSRRGGSSGSSSRFLWADAICINQDKTKERSHQVANMTNIYRNAGKVHIWLGFSGSEDESEAAISCINSLSRELCELSNIEISDLNRGGFADKVLWKRWSDLPPPQPSADSVKSLFALFASPWFTRLWVVQEVNVNEHCIIHFGLHSVEWLRVLLVACFLRTRSIEHFLISSGSCLAYAKTIGTKFHRNTSAATMLRSASRFQCEDHRDKVYGLLGIIKQGSRHFPLEVDYNKTVLEVYIDTMELFLATEDSTLCSSGLGILDQISYDGTPGWPSWVVRWDRAVNDSVSRNNLVNAARGTKAMPTINRMSDTLTLSGIIVDIVSFGLVSDEQVLNRQVMTGSRRTTFFLQWLPTFSTIRAGQDAYIASAMVLTSGRSSDEYRASPEVHGSNFHIYIDELLGSGCSAVPKLSREAQAFQHAFNQYTTKSKVWYFGTETGFRGCTRQSLTPGDLVCLLFGGRYPFILRPHNDGYLLIDQAYVYGIMDGEFLKDWQEGKLPDIGETTFKIY